MGQNFRIEIWRPGDTEVASEILEASSIAHQIQKKPPGWFKWKFRDSPWGPAVIAYARSSGGQLAGAVAFGSYRLKYQGRTLWAGVSYETFVHPEFRRRGLFRSLIGASEAEAHRRGFDLLFNFPNPASKPGFLGSGWADLGGIRTWIRPSSVVGAAGALVTNIRRRASFQPFEPDELHMRQLLESLPQLSPPAHTPNAVVRLHDVEFLKWRFSQSPVADYRVVRSPHAKALTRVGERSGLRELQVLEVFPDRPVNLPILREVMRVLKREASPELMSVLLSTGNPLNSLLPLLGFLPVPNHVSFCMKMIGPVGQPNPGWRWSISGADIHTW